MEINMPTPCTQEMKKYLELWNTNEKFVSQENALNLLFLEEFPNNTKIEEILIKSSVLNNFYSTNIFSIFDMAKHILSLDIDNRLKKGDYTLVSEIANIEIKNKKIEFYSFATKYCSHHNQTDFPIYDSFVKGALMYFKKVDKFDNFKGSDLKDYKTYKNILLKFAEFYGITSYCLKDLDMYLWQLGKIILSP